VVEGFLFNQSNQIVFRNQTHDSSAPVGDWESAVLSLARLEDVVKALNSADGNNILTHELLSSDKTVAMWNARNQDWHLLGPDCFFVQTSVANSTHEVRHAYSDHNWDENVDVLGSFHYDNYQGVRHSSISS